MDPFDEINTYSQLLSLGARIMNVTTMFANIRSSANSMKACMEIAQPFIPVMLTQLKHESQDDHLALLTNAINQVFVIFENDPDYNAAKEWFLESARVQIESLKVKAGQKRARSRSPTPEFSHNCLSEKDVRDIISVFVGISRKPSMQETIYLELFETNIFLIDNELVRMVPSALGAVFSKYTSGKVYLLQKEKDTINNFIEMVYLKQPVESFIAKISDEQLCEFLKNMNKQYKLSAEPQLDRFLFNKLYDQFFYCEDIMSGILEIAEGGIKLRNTDIHILLIETQKAINDVKERQNSRQKLAERMQESYKNVSKYKTKENIKIFGVLTWGTEVTFYVMENVIDSYLMMQVNNCQLPQNYDNMAGLLTTYAAFKDFNHLLRKGVKPFLSLECDLDKSDDDDDESVFRFFRR